MSPSLVQKAVPLVASTGRRFVSGSIKMRPTASFPSLTYIMQPTCCITTHSRPFQVLGLQQIAIGNTDKGPLSNLWTDIFGVQKIGNFKSEKENVDEDILRLGKEGSPHAVEIDLMMPIDRDKSPKVSVWINVSCTPIN